MKNTPVPLTHEIRVFCKEWPVIEKNFLFQDKSKKIQCKGVPYLKAWIIAINRNKQILILAELTAEN